MIDIEKIQEIHEKICKECLFKNNCFRSGDLAIQKFIEKIDYYLKNDVDPIEYFITLKEYYKKKLEK